MHGSTKDNQTDNRAIRITFVTLVDNQEYKQSFKLENLLQDSP